MIRTCLAFGLAIICSTTSLDAALISVLSVNNSTTSLSGGGSGDRALAQSLSVVNPGGSVADSVGNTVAASTRYISNVAADRGITFSGGTAVARVNTDYTLTFSTSALPTSTYEVIVSSSLLGELTLLDDIAGTQSNAIISDVAGSLGGVGNAGLSLAGIAENFSVGTGTNAAEERNKSASNLVNLGSFTGSQSFVLRFTFFTEARAPQSAIGSDEAAVRLGANGPLSGATADDYPGPGDVVDRNQLLDGHFVTATLRITAVPEPSSILLSLIGLVGLGGYRRRCC